MKQKDLVELAITVTLIVFMLFAIGSALKKKRPAAPGGDAKTQTSQPANLALEAAVSDNRVLYNVLKEEAEKLELKRDPFTAAPIIIEKNIQSGVTLTGILWDKDKPLAVIDGEILKKGSRIGNKTLVEIKRDRVILSDGEVFSEIILDR